MDGFLEVTLLLVKVVPEAHLGHHQLQILHRPAAIVIDIATADGERERSLILDHLIPVHLIPR